MSMRRRPKKEKRIDAKTIYTRASLGYDKFVITTDTDDLAYLCLVGPV